MMAGLRCTSSSNPTAILRRSNFGSENVKNRAEFPSSPAPAAPAHRAPAEPRPPVKHPAAVQAAPSAATAAVTQVAMPLGNPNSPLGNAISHQCAISNEPSDFVLPGAKGDIKVDRCYRGRDQLSCEFSVLTANAQFQAKTGIGSATLTAPGGR
jgi:hypothetical protein